MRQLCLLFLSVLLIGCGNNAKDLKYAKVTNVSSTLNIRESPNPQSSVIGKIEKNEKVEILSDNKAEWTHVRYGNLTGYVKSIYIQQVEEENTEVSSNSWWKSLQNTKAWTFLKGIGGIIIIIIGICLIILLFTGLMLIVGILVKIIGSGIGGGFLGLILGYFINNGDSNLAVEWMKWGFYIGCGIGIIIVLLNPIKEATEGFGDLLSIATKNRSSNSSKKRSSSPVQIYDHPGGDSYYQDEDGNLH